MIFLQAKLGRKPDIEEIAHVLAVAVGDCIGLMAMTDNDGVEITRLNEAMNKAAQSTFSKASRRTCAGSA